MEELEVDKKYIYALYGYDDEDELFIPDDKLFWGLQEISSDYEEPHIVLRRKRKEQILKGAQVFFNRHFKLHKIPYKDFLNNLDLQIMIHIRDVEKVARLCNVTNIYINPFSLPVRFIGNDETDTMVLTNAHLIDNKDFYSAIEISYRKIILNRQITDVLESSYVHELTHTQLSKRRGIVRKYLNSEVLPIFLELLNIYESGNYNLQMYGDVVRLNELIDHINVLYNTKIDGVTVDGDLLKSSIYAVSILKAYHLFIEYIYGSNSLKKYILNSIQNIFNGDLVLEELLDEFEITETSVMEGQQLKKYYLG